MSSKNIKVEYSNFYNITNKNNILPNKRNNRFSISKPSFLKKSKITPLLNSSNEGYHTYREEISLINKSVKNESLSIKRQKSNKVNDKNIQMKKNITTTNYNKLKNKNRKNKFISHRNDFSLNIYKKNYSNQYLMSLGNTSHSFFKNISKPKSINREKSNKEKNSKENSKKNNYIFKTICKNKEKKNFVLIKNKTNIIKKNYIFVQNKHNNNNKIQAINNIIWDKFTFNERNSARLSQRFKKMDLNIKNITEKIIQKNKSKENCNSNNSIKKFTFNDLKVHNNNLVQNKNFNEIQNKEININKINPNYKSNDEHKKIKFSFVNKDILLDNNNSKNLFNKNKINCLNYLNNQIKNEELSNKKKNKTQDNIKSISKSPKINIMIEKKNNSVRKRKNLNIRDTFFKILSNRDDISFQKTASNILLRKKQTFNANKKSKKLNGYCNLLILDNQNQKQLYTQTGSTKSLYERSKLLDYINFKVTNNKKSKEIKKEKIKKDNTINLRNNSYKIETMSRNIKNNISNNFTHTTSITLENNKTNYISPKQFEKEEIKGFDANNTLASNNFFFMTQNNSLKITVNNSNKKMINKNNSNNKKLQNNNSKKAIINKIMRKKKIIHDKNSSINIPSKKGVLKQKNIVMRHTPKLSFTPIMKENGFFSKIKPINKNQIKITKKVIKIDSCSVSGYSSPGIAKINQDNYFIIKEFMNIPEQFFMGICDGHGSYGHLISKYICNILPKKITKMNEENIIEAFLSVNKSLIEDSKIDCSLSGSTCSSLIITSDKIITANLGDSRAVLARYENGQYNAINLTRDHKPTESDEMKRILINGGRIKQFIDSRTGKNIGPERIWLKNSEIPGLAMSRSLGDNLAHMVGVISEPEIKTFDFNGNEKFILLASDGIWEYIDSDESIKIIKDFYENGMDAVGALNTIVKEAFKRWKNEGDNIDDITTILIFFE